MSLEKLRWRLTSFHSVWKPLRGPLRDWPLALCDPATVEPDHLTAADIVFKTRATENLQVHYDPPSVGTI